MAASSIPFGSSWKPGGVLAVTRGSLRGRVSKTGSDSMGRWVYTTFAGKAGRTITVTGTYQVCAENVKLGGPMNAGTKQYTLLEREKRRDSHKVQKQHANDLIKFAKPRQARGELQCVSEHCNDTIGEK